MTKLVDSDINLIDIIKRKREEQRNNGREGSYSVIFDIDSTVMETESRNITILQELAVNRPLFAPYVALLEEQGVGWSIDGSLRRVGLTNSDLLNEAMDFWRKRFFRDKYVLLDKPYPGVIECINTLLADEFHILFVTGRDTPGMSRGTLQSFANYGIQEGDLVSFYFKPSFSMKDKVFKQKFCGSIEKHQIITATFENEPRNANIFAEAFPEAVHFWIDTVTSPHPEQLNPNVISIKEYYQ